jgi:NAD(P)-dependent dehydrogenase (short-subunit alcohol dehydrogenase family)
MSTARLPVVTGGATGIGRGMANAFARRDFWLVLAGVDVDRRDQAVDELRVAGAEAIGVPTDVHDATAVDALAATAQETFGRIDVACNNAGVDDGNAMETSLDEWKWVVDVNTPRSAAKPSMSSMRMPRPPSASNPTETTPKAAPTAGCPLDDRPIGREFATIRHLA